MRSYLVALVLLIGLASAPVEAQVTGQIGTLIGRTDSANTLIITIKTDDEINDDLDAIATSVAAIDASFPAAVTLANNLALPSTVVVGAALLCYDSVGVNIDFCITGDTTFGTSTYTETTSTGPLVGGVRNDTPDSLAGTTNETTPFGFASTGGVWNTEVPGTNGGWLIYRSLDLDEGAGEVIKASAGQLGGMWVTNVATTTRYIKVYNATSCTMGTGTPVITFGLPGGTTDDVAGNLTGNPGIEFLTGICVGATTGVADADVGAPGANDVVLNAFYK